MSNDTANAADVTTKETPMSNGSDDTLGGRWELDRHRSSVE